MMNPGPNAREVYEKVSEFMETLDEDVEDLALAFLSALLNRVAEDEMEELMAYLLGFYAYSMHRSEIVCKDTALLSVVKIASHDVDTQLAEEAAEAELKEGAVKH